MSDADANRFAAESLRAGDPTGWFERLYGAAADGRAVVPWTRDEPNAQLAEWVEAKGLRGEGRRAIVVGCGLGADAEYVAGRGFATTAFDISETAIRLARERHPQTPVEYVTADLLDLPGTWIEAFDLVVEVITVQALPDPPRAQAIVEVTRLVKPGGTLIVWSGAREATDQVDGPPWTLTPQEIYAFAAPRTGLQAIRMERLGDRWLAEFRRPQPASASSTDS